MISLLQDSDLQSRQCPFCCSEGIRAVPGKVVCQKCRASFDIADRAEYVFVDPLVPKLPIKRTSCQECGLVQDSESENGVLCNAPLVGVIQ